MVKSFLKTVLSIISITLISTKPTLADEVLLSSGDLKRNVFASRISICSEVREIDEEAISSFYSRYFNGWNAPIFGAPVDERSYQVGQNILFVASDGHVGSRLRECLAEYTLVSDDLEEHVGKEADRLHRGLGALEGVKLPSYYNPVSASWGYMKKDNWLIISFMSKEEKAYRVNHALTHLFGLKITVCETSSACSRQFE